MRTKMLSRQEPFGGILFDSADGKTIELNKSGFFILNEAAKGKTEAEITTQTEKFFKKKDLADYVRDFLLCFDSTKIKPVRVDRDLWLAQMDCLTAPESVHLIVTKECNLNCPGCYAASGEKSKSEMSKEEIISLVDELAELRVFQLAIGGGEPFLRKDIFKIAGYARNKGIVVTVTTNATLIDKKLAKKTKESGIRQIQVSLDGHCEKVHEMQREKGSFEGVLDGLRNLRETGQRFGVNTLVTRNNLEYLPRIIEFISGVGAAEHVILRLKPSGRSKEWFYNNNLGKDDFRKLQEIVLSMGKEHHLRIDTSLCFVFRNQPVEELREMGIYGCTAGVRFCTVSPDGNVFPCSHFEGREFIAGNIRREPLRAIWDNGKPFKKFRQINNQLKGKCRNCSIKGCCGGCRRITLEMTGDFYAEDPECCI